MELNVIIKDGNWEKVRIKSSELDSKKHLHHSGREFSADEIKSFKWSKEDKKETVKKEDKKSEK